MQLREMQLKLLVAETVAAIALASRTSPAAAAATQEQDPFALYCALLDPLDAVGTAEWRALYDDEPQPGIRRTPAHRLLDEMCTKWKTLRQVQEDISGAEEKVVRVHRRDAAAKRKRQDLLERAFRNAVNRAEEYMRRHGHRKPVQSDAG